MTRKQRKVKCRECDEHPTVHSELCQRHLNEALNPKVGFVNGPDTGYFKDGKGNTFFVSGGKIDPQAA